MIHVGFVVDNNYCKYLAVTLATILKSSSEKDDYTFHIINDGSINDVSKNKLNELKKIRNFEIKYYSQDKKLHHEKRNDTRNDISMVTNYRLMISSILSDIDKVIFMDADLIVVNDIRELWDINIDDCYMACCSSINDATTVEYKKQLDIPPEYYYCNTGVMLVNLKKWRAEGIEEKLFEKEKQYRGIYRFYDQCIFNITLYDKIKYINQKFNFRPGIWGNSEFMNSNYGKEGSLLDINPVVVHWASPVKPWQDNMQPFAADYFDFAKLTPYYYELQIESIYKFKKNVGVKPCKLKWYKKILSMRNSSDKKHKLVYVLGLKFSVKKN